MKVAKASRAIFTFLSQKIRVLRCCMLELLTRLLQCPYQRPAIRTKGDLIRHSAGPARQAVMGRIYRMWPPGIKEVGFSRQSEVVRGLAAPILIQLPAACSASSKVR